jgi:hypothetical protein
MTSLEHPGELPKIQLDRRELQVHPVQILTVTT